MNKSLIAHPHATRRAFFSKAARAGAVLGTGLLPARRAFADNADPDSRPNAIPGGVAPFNPFGIFVHHNPLNAANPISKINDPSQITDFDGFVALTHIRGGGTGTNTVTGVSTPYAYQADMGFSQGSYIGTDGHNHEGTFVFV